MFAKPQAEHQWLEQLGGNWEFEHVCYMPDGSHSTTYGNMTCRMLGGMWLLCESSGDSSEGPWSSVMTVGFDVSRQEYVGTFIGSMMSNIWPYHGTMSEDGKKLPLYSEGPKFDGSGVGKYRDTILVIDEDHWHFTSELLSDDGRWTQFLLGKQYRPKSTG